MRDGNTRRLKPVGDQVGFQGFLADYEAKVVVVSGTSSGSQYPVDRERLTLGRGPGVDLPFKNPAMSRQHAAVIYTSDGFRIQDLGSTNGIVLNGRPVQVGEIRHGDHFEIGGQAFQFVVEARDDAPQTYEIPES